MIRLALSCAVVVFVSGCMVIVHRVLMRNLLMSLRLRLFGDVKVLNLGGRGLILIILLLKWPLFILRRWLNRLLIMGIGLLRIIILSRI